MIKYLDAQIIKFIMQLILNYTKKSIQQYVILMSYSQHNRINIDLKRNQSMEFMDKSIGCLF